MPEDTTAVQTDAQPSNTSAAEPTGEQDAPGGAAPGAEATDTAAEVSPSELAFARLLHGDRGQGDDTEAEETTEQPAAGATQTGKTGGQQRPEPVIAGPFDTAGFTKAMVDEVGAGAKGLAETIGGQFNALFSKIETLESALAEATEAKGLKDEIGKLRKEFEPIGKRVGEWSAAEQRAKTSETHKWFDARAGYADRYGKGALSSHTQDQQMARVAVVDCANDLVEKAEKRGRPLTFQKALAMSEALLFEGGPTRAGAVEAVRGDVKKQARGISVDPGRSSAGRSTQQLTPEQDREQRVAAVDRIEREARAGKGK